MPSRSLGPAGPSTPAPPPLRAAPGLRRPPEQEDVWNGAPRLLVAFFSGEQSTVRVERAGERVRLRVDGESCELSRSAARELREAVGEAASGTRAFLHTRGEHRPDGSYVVARRGADSAGNRKVFASFDRLTALFADLPERFGAADVEAASGSRRHMVVRHLAEHPAFDCAVVAENPLTVEKAAGRSGAGPEPSE